MLNAKKLGTIFVMAIFSRHFGFENGHYFEAVFLEIPQRTDY